MLVNFDITTTNPQNTHFLQRMKEYLYYTP